MKVKELIAELQKCDQEAVVNCGGDPIWFVDQAPGAYDGYYCELIVDGHPVKFQFRRDGRKVILRTLSAERYIENVLEFNNNAEPAFEFIQMRQPDEAAIKQHIQKTVDEERRQNKIFAMEQILEK